jgi:hypothetical protein
MLPSVKEMLRIQKGPKIPESYERDSITETKREMLRLSSANTYEEIGRACVEISKELDPFQMDDIIKARVFNRISLRCLMALIARVRDTKPEPPKKTASQKLYAIANRLLRGIHE